MLPSYALITGASSGIGMAMAEALARNGHNLILVGRQRDALESIACELIQRFDVEVLFRVCNLTEPMQLSGLILELEESNLNIRLLINNAGIGHAGALIEQDWRNTQQQIELNILALTRLCQAIGARMAAQGGGKILNVASIAAFQPGPWLSCYYASKAYVLSFSEGLREELKNYGVHVCTLCPGATRSAFFRNARLSMQRLEGTPWLMRTEDVARIALQGLSKNRAVIIPGWRNQLLCQLPRLLPRVIQRRLAAKRNWQLLDLTPPLDELNDRDSL
jgi:short-subunit dehydrogenase